MAARLLDTMRGFRRRLLPVASRAPYGHSAFTLLELVVALVVFGVALSGMVPLVAILSRDLQPVRHVAADGSITYQVGSPARDGNITGEDIDPPPAYVKHIWYMTAYDDPWVRKLSAGAQLTPVVTGAAPPAVYTTATSPAPIQPHVLAADNDQDQSDEPYKEEGGWANESNTGAYGDDVHRQATKRSGIPPSSAHCAIWTLTVQSNGWYSLQATWPASSDQVNDAAFTVWKNGVQIGAAAINQTIPPDDTEDPNGSLWENITASPVRLAKDDVIEVRLSDIRATTDENGLYAAADAVRLIEIKNDVRIVSLERSLTGANQNSENQDVTVHVAVTVNLPQ